MANLSAPGAAGSADAEQANMGFIITTALVATIGGFLFGYDSGVINGTVDGLRGAFGSEDIGTGFNVASMLLGCAIGAAFAGRAADIFGRRTMMIVAAVFFVISAWGSGVANSSGEFIVFRILGGLAVGAASVMAPAYISEIAPARMRGRLTTIQQIAIISGLFFSFLANYLLANAAGGSTAEFWLGFQTWRWMFWVELIPAIIFFIALFRIPESPRFLVIKGKTDQAEAVLTRLFGAEAAKMKVEEIRASLASDHKPKLSDLLDREKGGVRLIVWAGIGLAVFQQLVGINVVFYYGAVLWQSVGLSEGDALMINVVSGALSIAAVIAGLMVIDKVGRKPMLLIGSFGMAVTLGLVAYAFSTGTFLAAGTVLEPGTVLASGTAYPEGAVLSSSVLDLRPSMGLLALVAANVYVMFFNFSWGPVMWVMLGEMFPNQIRGSGLAVSGFAQWIANFAITMSFPIMAAGLGLMAAYSFYATCALISFFFVLVIVRETRGKELEQMTG
ncbi:sugar porter family MFS transporter [Alkalicaulis satelles]|uniref:Sugar porter family MFS transporter n=1 Tax=Alkalicaulis satelles TaxID=2609175 RepID=A0A5M6ZJQ0_9PROT|nr:sugar porter family MFS transporter [Alkalicaulis satelles]KAA5805052.1 sugar porter family MFS transporter [Alkalicaulis satelles]